MLCNLNGIPNHKTTPSKCWTLQFSCICQNFVSASMIIVESNITKQMCLSRIDTIRWLNSINIFSIARHFKWNYKESWNNFPCLRLNKSALRQNIETNFCHSIDNGSNINNSQSCIWQHSTPCSENMSIFILNLNNVVLI